MIHWFEHELKHNKSKTINALMIDLFFKCYFAIFVYEDCLIDQYNHCTFLYNNSYLSPISLQAEKSLDINFTPLDVEMENYPELPELLLRPENLKLVKRFVREWNRFVTNTRGAYYCALLMFS